MQLNWCHLAKKSINKSQ